jgi:hypothetical protein
MGQGSGLPGHLKAQVYPVSGGMGGSVAMDAVEGVAEDGERRMGPSGAQASVASRSGGGAHPAALLG